MHGRGYRLIRCDGCGLVPAACACGQLPRVDNSNAITLLAHVRELRKPSNTGRLAVKMLSNARLIARGGPDEVEGRAAEASLDELDPSRTLLLFPREDARPLEEVATTLSSPVQLLIPDGTWSQTRRLVRRHTALQRLPAVTVSSRSTRYLLRRGSVPGLSCTLEAIARALGTLEGAEVESRLMSGFEHWQRAALAIRGRLRLLDELALDPAPGL